MHAYINAGNFMAVATFFWDILWLMINLRRYTLANLLNLSLQICVCRKIKNTWVAVNMHKNFASWEPILWDEEVYIESSSKCVNPNTRVWSQELIYIHHSYAPLIYVPFFLLSHFFTSFSFLTSLTFVLPRLLLLCLLTLTLLLS